MNTETAFSSDSDGIYKAIFENSAMPGIIFRGDGRILNANPAFAQLYGGQSSQPVNGIALEDLFPRQQRKRVVNLYQHPTVTKSKSSPLIFQRSDGEERSVRLIIRPLGDNNLLYATLIDITEAEVHEKRIQHLVDQISVINEIVAAVNSNLNKNQLIQVFFNQINRIFNCDRVCILLFDIEAKELEIHCSKDASEIESRKEIGPFCQSFASKLSSCHPVEQNLATVARLVRMLGLPMEQADGSPTLIQLKTDEQLIGAVILYHRSKKSFTQFDRDIFRKIASPIAIAFMKARLLHRYQQSLTNLSFLASINESLSSSLNLDVVLKQLVESSQQIMQAKICTIHLLNTNSSLINHPGSEFENNLLDHFKPQIRQVIQNRRPLIVENIDYNSIQFFKNRTDIHNLNLKSLMVLPIVANQETIALLSVFLDKIHYFSEHEIELLAMLANQAAIAIKNAELYKQVEKNKNFLESIIHSSSHIIISTDLDGKTTFFNNSACSKIGFAANEVLTLPFFERFIKNGQALFEGLKRELLDRGHPQSFECEISTKHGRSLRIAWLFSALINQQQEIIGTLGIGREITKPQPKKNIALVSSSRES